MRSCINIVALSGKVGWVKLKYGSTGKLQLHFSLLQPFVKTEAGAVVNRGYSPFFCTCFKGAENYQGLLKEGSYVAVQGKIHPFTVSEGINSLAISVDKIDVYGLTEN